MVNFDKNIGRDPAREKDFVKTPGDDREGPLCDVVMDGIRSEATVSELIDIASAHDERGSYHYEDAKVAHWSQSDGCSTQAYLNYAFNLLNGPEVPANDDKTERTFKHGDLIHLWIQGIFVQELGEEHVTIEENVDGELDKDIKAPGHADIVVRGSDDFPEPFVVDIKTTKSFTYYDRSIGAHARTVPKDSHIKQLTGYMNHVDADYGSLLYYSKSGEHIEEYWIAYRDEIFQDGKEHLMNIMEHVEDGSVPEKDADAYLCDPEYCVFRREGICPGVKESDHHDPSEDRLDEFEFEQPPWND